MPSSPKCSFASDNFAGAHPRVVDAVAAANTGHVMAYGGDVHTAECEARFRDLFGPTAQTFLAFTGTGANVLALATMLKPAQAIVCTKASHIAVDETGAPERILGAKLIDLPSDDGKVRPEQLDGLAHLIGVTHHAQPGVVSLTQSTELGTLYTADEIASLCETAHRLGMSVHVDGARMANAVAALGGTVAALRSLTVDAGVDVLSFGGTKNGLIGGEAVVYLNPEFATAARFVRKQVTQLASKMRFVAAQFNALLHDGLWLELATHANDMAALLHRRTAGIEGVDAFDPGPPPRVNSLFPRLPPAAIEPLRDWCFFWDWDVASHQVRWMTSWDTTVDDVEVFAKGVAKILATRN
jgi:threonine aldolase